MNLSETIDHLSRKGYGILAADESNNTIGKRFATINIENNYENRRIYRSLIAHTSGLNKYIAGIILFEETLTQQDNNNNNLIDVLKNKNILIGIKVDQGLTPLANFPNELVTEGLDGLYSRMERFNKMGASFAKWRNVFTINQQLPSDTSVLNNSENLARYAAICQANNIVPIVEPEVLMDGDHSLQKCAEVTEKVISELFNALIRHKVQLEYIVLKPNMVLPGSSSNEQVTDLLIAETTIAVLKRSVPEAVPCINFLSGGQTPEQATTRLNLMNLEHSNPWILSYSYGRALQEDMLKTWQGNPENASAAQQALLYRAQMNSLASIGEYKKI